MNKILYLQVGVGFLHVNKRVIEELQKHFPAYEIELYDLLYPVKKNLAVIIWNSLVVLKEYFVDFITRRKSISSFKYHFLGTTFIFKHFSSLVRKKVKTENYQCIIQTQCLCDSSGNGIPVYIYTDHTNLNNLNYKWTNPAKYLRTPGYRALEKIAFQRADLIFVMSENIRRSLIDQYDVAETKIKLAYVGSNTAPPTQDNPAKYFNKNIIFVGKDWSRKGGPLLVKAFEGVLKEIPDATLTIIGCNPTVSVRNCTVYGEIGLDEVARHYREASVFCLPTVREPFGIVFIEAMLNKLPIVTNRMGAAPYLVTERNGYLLENNAEGYTRFLVSLLMNPHKCMEFGEESFRIAREFYTWKNVGEIIAENINIGREKKTTPQSIKLENTLT